MKKIITALCLLWATVAGAQCDTVTNLTISNLTYSSGRATFTPPAQTVSTYSWAIFTYPAGVFTGVQGTGPATIVNFTGLSASTQYRFRIATVCLTAGTSVQANKVFTTGVNTVPYTPMAAAGYQFKYIKFDSGALFTPGDTILGRAPNVGGQVKFKSSDSLFYYYNGVKWKPLAIDSFGIVAQLNDKVDSVTIVGTILYYWKLGVGYGYTLPAVDSVYFQNGGPPGFNLLRQKNDSVFVFKSIVFGLGLQADSTTTDSVITVSLANGFGRFGVSGEDDIATQDRVFDGGTHVLQMNWRSPYDATQTLNFFPYYHVDGMHNIAEMRVQANQSGAGGSGNYLSVGVDNSSGVVLNAGDNTGEHKAILIRTDSVLVFTNNGATINTAFAISGTGAGLPAVSFPSIQKATSLGTHRVALIDTANKQISYINYDSLRTATSVPLSGITAPASTNIIAMGGFNFGLTGGNFGVGVTPSYRLDVLSSSAGVFAANITNNSSTGAGVGINTFSSSTETLFQLLSGALGSTSRLRMNANGHLQIGAGISPSALLQLDPGTATAGTAPLKFTSGTVMGTPEAGALEYNNGLLMLDSSNSQRDTIATRKWARNNISGGGGSSQWITTGSDIYYNTGKVFIGGTTGTDMVHLKGASSNGLTVEGSQPMLTLNATSNDPQITLTRGGNSSNMYVNSSLQLVIQGYNEIKAQQSGTTGFGIVSYVGPSFNSAFSIGSTSNPTSTLQSYGSFATAVVIKTGTYTATDYDHTIFCNTNSFTINLPTAAGITGRAYTIKNIASGTTITIDGSGSETIDGVTTKILNTQYSGYTITSDGTNWYITATF